MGLNDKGSTFFEGVVGGITHLNFLADIVQDDTKSFDVRKTAIGQLAKKGEEGQKVLADLATDDSNSAVRYFTVRYLTNANVLKSMVKNDMSEDVSKAAENRITKLPGFVQSVPKKPLIQLKFGA